MKREDIINEKLDELSKSDFRSSFKLKDIDVKYIKDKGIDVIEEHARIFVKDRIAGNIIRNDGKQTPMKGHPVFVAQHACACCCRGCLYKWHGMSMNRYLTKNEINYIVELIMTWIERQL